MPDFPDTGYVYLAFGPRKYFEEVAVSITSLRRHDPSAHATLITDRGSAANIHDLTPHFDHVEAWDDIVDEKDTWKNRLMFKVKNLYENTPYNRAFFIDTDTYFLGSCRSLFDLLDHYDLCLAHGTNDRNQIEVKGNILTGYTPYNTGVMLFRKSDTVANLFSRWCKRYEEKIDAYPHDQPAFMYALIDVSCRTYVLQNNWNARFIYPEKYYGKVMILHGRHSDHERVARRINASTGPRVWLPHSEACLYEGMPLSALGGVIGSLAYRRCKTVAGKLMRRIANRA